MSAWQLAWQDKRWTEDDLKGRHLSLITVGTGSDTWEISPTAGPVRLMAVLAAFIAIDEDRSYVEVVAELQEASAIELVGSLSIIED